MGSSVRAAPRVPLVVLPATTEVLEPISGAATVAVALDRLSRLAAEPDRRIGLDAALPIAVRECRRLLVAQTCAGPVDNGERMPADFHVHEYFGVRRGKVSARDAAVHATAIVYRALVDLGFATVDGNDIAAEATGMRLALTSAGAKGKHENGPLVDYRPDGDGLERWIVTHHLYFLFNVRAADHIRLAIGALGERRWQAAAESLRVAAEYVRALTAAMAHSAALSRDYYRDVVRPTMSPPAAPTELTGRMQPEHRAYRRGLGALLDVLDQPYDELHARSPALATAREELLDADLLDIERHVCVADALVRADRSLVQQERGSENAVATLRQMRHQRAARYRPLVRYGDPLLSYAD
ncbi:hypothetical protein [Fodinicola feengrottensis]|uniref:hypothetical protein n=1 Tax=Fodinicola feengrottensis TaxID=435914 RepID=UPI0031E3D618